MCHQDATAELYYIYVLLLLIPCALSCIYSCMVRGYGKSTESTHVAAKLRPLLPMSVSLAWAYRASSASGFCLMIEWRELIYIYCPLVNKATVAHCARKAPTERLPALSSAK